MGEKQTNGGCFFSGILFWAIAAVIIGGVILSPFASILGDWMGAKKANAEADRAAEERSKMYAQAELESARAYNEAASRSLKADTYRAHPELYFVDAIRWVVIIGLGAVAAFFVYLVWLSTHAQRKDTRSG